MKRLVIYPTFSCPFSCNFCFNKNRNTSKDILPIHTLKEFMTKFKDSISDIVISGGEPMLLDKSYFNSMIDTLKAFEKPITISSYPISLENYRDDIDYNLSYDFMIRPRALDVWENLLAFKKKFDLTVTISPLVFKLHPNALLQKLSLLPNLNSVEFVPYYKNDCSEYDITKNDCLIKFNQLLLQSKLNIPFKLINKEKAINVIFESKDDSVDICLFPNGQLYYQNFDERGILKYIPTTEEVFTSNITKTIPSDVDLYSNDIIEWFKNNVQ